MNSQSYLSSVFVAALALGCTSKDPGDDTQASTTSTSSMTSGNQSGSVTSAPGGTTDGTASDSAPTMATASTTPSDGSSTGEGCQSLNCDDMLHGELECDNFAQDCPEGQKCAAWADGGDSWNATHCVEVTGTGVPGDDCTVQGHLTGIDSCIKGAMCWDTNAEGIGTCIALCTGSANKPMCPNNISCSISGGGELNLCLSGCDPLLQDCLDNAVCLPTDDSFVCVLDGGGAEGQANDPCDFPNACDPGLMCRDPATAGAGCDPAAEGCCTPFCEFPDGACPNPDQSCVQWFDPMQLPENDPQLDIGICAVPG